MLDDRGVWHGFGPDLCRLVEKINGLVFSVSMEGAVMEWSDNMVDMSGYSRAEVLGQPLVRLLPPENSFGLQSLFSFVFGPEAERPEQELTIVARGGRRKTLIVESVVRHNIPNLPVGIIVLAKEKNAQTTPSSSTALWWSDFADSCSTVAFGVDLQGMVTQWNPIMASLMGIRKDEALGKNLVEEVLHKNDHDRMSQILRSHEKRGDLGCSVNLTSKGGTLLNFRMSTTPQREPSGQVIGHFFVAQDVTDLHAALTDSKKVSDTFTTLIETINTPIFNLDTNCKITEWNASAHAVSGFSRLETVGWPFVDNFIHMEHRASVDLVLAKALSGERTENFLMTFFTKNAEKREILLNTSPHFAPDGALIGVTCVGQDITEMNAERRVAMRVAEDLTRLIQTANAPIFGVDTQGRVTEWNHKIAELSQYTKEETMGQSLVHFITDEFKQSVSFFLLKALNCEETANFEIPLMGKAIVLVNATTRLGPNGDVIGVLGVGQDITELRTMTVEQGRIADDLSRLIENANAPIFGVDVDGMVTEWNRKAADMLGYSKQDAVGKNFVNNFIQQENRSSVEQVLTRALQGIETSNFELPTLSKNGKRFTVLLNATTRRDAKGQVTGVLGVGQDITELNNVLAESKRTADDLTRLIDTANAPIFGIDTEGRVTEWNAKASSLLGFSKLETMGKLFVEGFIEEEFKASVSGVLAAALTGKETANFQFSMFSRSGARIDILLNATTRRGPDHQVIGVIGVGQDITEIRTMTAQQERIADDLSRLIENANAPIFGVDVNGMVTEWNRKAADLLGFAKNETIGKHLVGHFIQMELRSSVEDVLTKALAGVETSNYELPLISKTGNSYTVLLNATTRRDATGAITGVMGVGQDITALNMVAAESKRVADDLVRLIETANAPIFGIDTEGKVNEWNAKASHLLGFSKAETMGRYLVTNFIHADYQGSVSEVLSAALQGKETANFEFPLFTRENSRIDILLNATPRTGADGSVIGVIGVGQDITQIRSITAEQQRFADDLARLIENANAPIFGVDVNGMVTEWNRKAADLLGYPKSEAVGKHLVRNFIQPEHRQSVEDVLHKALSGIETTNYELSLTPNRGGGKRLTVWLNATTRRDAKGKITGVVGVGQDITELNQLMAESNRVVDYLQSLIETANAPIFGVDSAGKITEWNAKIFEVSGFSKTEAMGMDLIANLIPLSAKDSVSSVFSQALTGLKTATFEFPINIKNSNKQAQILMNATPLRGPDGSIMGIIGVGQDITDLREAKESAEQKSSEMAKLIDSANAPIFAVNKDGYISEWNQMMGKISGVPRVEAMGQSLIDNFLPDAKVKARVATVLERALKGSDTSNFELSLKSRGVGGKDSENAQPVLLLNATARVSAVGEITGVIGVGQDITEITSYKALEERKMRFMAMVSHELRSPIHGICGLSESLAHAERDPHRKKQLGMIRSCSIRLLDLVSNIMDVSNMKQKNLRLNKDSCDLAQIVEETVLLLEHATDKHGKPVRNKNVQFVNKMEPGMPIIEADSHRCSQVFYNLLMNALKFTKAGHVVIRSSVPLDKKWVQVIIEDTGIGINPANVERIFEPFEQEDDRESRAFEGIGLGLAISREVVRRHGGDISVHTFVGQGSTFTVTLPTDMAEDRVEACSVVEESPLDAPEPRSKPLEPRSKPLELVPPTLVQTRKVPERKTARKTTVLSVDDTPVSQEVIKAALAPDDYDIVIAMSGPECLEILEKGESLPDIILMDVMMPEMSGLEVCRRVRNEMGHSHSVLPIIMVSAKSPAPRQVIDGLTNGTNDCIAKPYSNEELRVRVKTLLLVKEYFAMRKEEEDQQQLVNSILPSYVADRAISGGNISYRHKIASVVVCSIVGWAVEMDHVSPADVTRCINGIFAAFERVAENKATTEIVGDMFMAVTTPNGDDDGDHFDRIAALALELREAMKAFHDALANVKLGVRVSLHTGPLFSGVLGSNPPRYSHYGRAIEFARRLDILCAPDGIHVSQGVRSMLCTRQKNALFGRHIQKHVMIMNEDGTYSQTYMIWGEGKVKPIDMDLYQSSNISEPTKAKDRKWHILSVDDDTANQDQVTQICNHLKFKLTTATDGNQCLEIIASAKSTLNMPDLILLESHMQGKSGFDVCRQLRQTFNHLELPIIMVTCHSSTEEVSAALLAGCNDYVMKPFHNKELMAHMHVQISVLQCVARLSSTSMKSEAQLELIVCRSKVTQLEVECAQATSDLVKCEKKLAETKSAFDKHQEKARKLEADLSVAKREAEKVRKLEAELSVAKGKTEEQTANQRKVDACEAELRETRASSEQLRKTQNELAEARQMLERFRQEAETLKSQLNEIELGRRCVEDPNATHEGTVARSSLEDQHAHERLQCALLTGRLVGLQSEVTRLRKNFQRSEAKSVVAAAEASVMWKEMDGLDNEVDAEHMRCEESKAHLRHLELAIALHRKAPLHP